MAKDTARPSNGAPTVEAGQLAKILGLNEREVRDLSVRGLLIRVGRGRYDFANSILTYVKHLREIAGRHKSSTGLDNQSENALFTRERRRRLALDGEIEAAKLIPVAFVEGVMADHIKGMRGMILGIVNEAQTEMPELSAFELETLRKICEKQLRDNTLRVIEVTGMHPEIKDYVDQRRGAKTL